MKTWEKHLFSTLDEQQAMLWRKAKEFEIQKWESDEAILEEIERIKLQIVEKEKKEKEKEKEKAQKNIMASMMEGVTSTFCTHLPSLATNLTFDTLNVKQSCRVHLGQTSRSRKSFRHKWNLQS